MLGVADDASPKDITKAYRKLAREHPPRRQPGQRRRRGALQGGLGRLRRARRRGQAQGVRRGPPARADGAAGSAAVGPAASRFNVGDVPDGDIGDLLGQMFGARPRPRAGRRWRARASARSAAPTSRPRSRSTSPTPCTASRPRCTSRRDARAPRATAPAPGPARTPTRVRRLRRARRHRRQPGPVLVLVAVPRLPGPRLGHRRPVPHLPRHAASSAGPAR